MSYNVGQVLYTIIKEKQVVIPVRVVEQIIKKNLDGEETSYKVLLPNKKSQKVDLEKLENVFQDLDDVNSYLLKKSKSTIDKMIEDAMILEEDFFEEKVKEEIDMCISETKNSIINSDQIKVDLGNGQVANLINSTGILGKEVLDKTVEGEDTDESVAS
jgi:hypothetical protein